MTLENPPLPPRLLHPCKGWEEDLDALSVPRNQKNRQQNLLAFYQGLNLQVFVRIPGAGAYPEQDSELNPVKNDNPCQTPEPPDSGALTGIRFQRPLRNNSLLSRGEPRLRGGRGASPPPQPSPQHTRAGAHPQAPSPGSRAPVQRRL